MRSELLNALKHYRAIFGHVLLNCPLVAYVPAQLLKAGKKGELFALGLVKDDLRRALLCLGVRVLNINDFNQNRLE